MPEWEPSPMRFGLHAELRCLLVRRHYDSKPNMKMARVEQAHAEGLPCGNGLLHTLVHEPEASISIKEIFDPYSR